MSTPAQPAACQPRRRRQKQHAAAGGHPDGGYPLVAMHESFGRVVWQGGWVLGVREREREGGSTKNLVAPLRRAAALRGAARRGTARPNRKGLAGLSSELLLLCLGLLYMRANRVGRRQAVRGPPSASERQHYWRRLGKPAAA